MRNLTVAQAITNIFYENKAQPTKVVVDWEQTGYSSVSIKLADNTEMAVSGKFAKDILTYDQRLLDIYAKIAKMIAIKKVQLKSPKEHLELVELSLMDAFANLAFGEIDSYKFQLQRIAAEAITALMDYDYQH
jgi:hypothetical protein